MASGRLAKFWVKVEDDTTRTAAGLKIENDENVFDIVEKALDKVLLISKVDPTTVVALRRVNDSTTVSATESAADLLASGCGTKQSPLLLVLPKPGEYYLSLSIHCVATVSKISSRLAAE